MKRYSKIALSLAVALFAALPVTAQEVVAEEAKIIFADKYSYEITLGLVAIMLVVILIVVAMMSMFMMWSVNDLRRDIRRARGLETQDDSDLEQVWERLNQALSDAVPVEEEEKIELDHNYDGIKELDNNLPPWWTALFYVTIAFAVVYMIHFHVTPISFLGEGLSSTERYEVQMAKAKLEKAAYLEKMANKVNENNVAMLDDASALAKGQAIYTNNCLTCHGNLGQGGAGPNLTDQYWIHGGGIKNVFSTVKYGVSGKAMREWQSLLTPLEIQQVSSYVITLQENNPMDGKAPEGDLWLPDEPKDGEVTADSTGDERLQDVRLGAEQDVGVDNERDLLETDTADIDQTINEGEIR